MGHSRQSRVGQKSAIVRCCSTNGHRTLITVTSLQGGLGERVTRRAQHAIHVTVVTSEASARLRLASR
jgi:hypothetical protein